MTNTYLLNSGKAFKQESKIGSRPPYYISIKKSTIPGAGLGAFAKCDLPKGIIIGEYLGKIFKPDKEDPNSAYKFEVLNSTEDAVIKIIDGRYKKYSSWVRFVNTTPTENDANCFFTQIYKRIFLCTQENIPKGQEIFAWYGESYINDLKEEFGKLYKPRISTKMKGHACHKQ